jgi:hypothetical protein
MGRFKLSLFLMLVMLTSFAKSDNWVDIDGGAIVRFKDESISIFSLNSFFYFDQIFNAVRKEKKQLRLCIGKGDMAGRPNDCFEDVSALPRIYNQGKNRALHLDFSSHPFVIELLEDQLVNGHLIKISIDDGDLFSAYTLHKTHIISEEADRILSLK